MIIIGELINSTRKKIRKAMEDRDAAYIRDLAEKQDTAGADYIDVNAGAFAEEEHDYLKWALEQVQEVTQKPLAVDSPQGSAIKLGLELNNNGKPVINSITREQKKWDEILPLAVDNDCYILGLCMNDGGIPESADARVKIADEIINGLIQKGKAEDDIFIDPLTTPVSADQKLGTVLLETIEKLKSNYPGIKTVTGLSNVSFGLPARKQVNRACMGLCLSRGLDGALIDPLDSTMMSIIKAAEAVIGRDSYCMSYLKAFRDGKIEKA